MVRFDQKRGKLSPYCVGPFEILERAGKVAYRLALPPKMSRVHNVFDTHVIDFNDIEVSDNVSYQERPVRILDHGTQKLRSKEIPLDKVQCKHHHEGEAL